MGNIDFSGSCIIILLAKMTHTELCNLGARWLKLNGLINWQKPKYVIVEIESVGISQPDIFGFGCSYTQQIEVKVSRSDFLADKKKHHRKHPHLDVGQLRSYLCPSGIILLKDLPDNWGLIWIDDKGYFSVLKEPIPQDRNASDELKIIYSILRRIGIKSQIFSFKNYKEK